MKFQRIRDIAMGAMVAALVVGTAPTAFAKVANMSIPVQYNNIKVVVDGNQLSTSKEPFIYDGITYLPLRAVAEAVGMNVSWDAATKTANLTSKAEVKTPVVETPAEKPTETKEESKRMGEITSKNTVYAENVEIKCTGAEEVNDYMGGIKLNFKLKNPSSMNYSVSTSKVYVNGKAMTAGLYTSLNNDRTIEDSIRIYEKDLKDAEITQIKNVKVEFNIWNKGTYDSYDDKEMTIQFKY